MTKKEVYLRAAELVASGAQTHSCTAIGAALKYDQFAIGHESYAYTEAYRAAMGFPNTQSVPDDPFLWEIHAAVETLNYPFRSEKLRDFRVMLLCMMAVACGDLD